MPARVKLNPVRVPPSRPAKVRLSTSICAASCASVSWPSAPAVTTWKYTGIVALKPAFALPLAEAGRSCRVPRSGSRCVTGPPRAASAPVANGSQIASAAAALAGHAIAATVMPMATLLNLIALSLLRFSRPRR